MSVLIEIELKNWEKHNPKIKKSYTHFLLSKRFFDDPIIANLRLIDVVTFIKLLSIAADMTSNRFTINAGMMPRRWRISDATMLNCCKTLQENQLLSYEILTPLYKRKEKKENEIKIKEFPDRSKTKEEKEQNKIIWETYFNAYRLRYGVNPIRNATTNSQISNLRKKLGLEDSIRVIEFFIKHNDSWYLKNTHSFGLCLKNCETLRTQMLRGVQITNTTIKQFERADAFNETMKKIDEVYK